MEIVKTVIDEIYPDVLSFFEGNTSYVHAYFTGFLTAFKSLGTINNNQAVEILEYIKSK